MKRNKYISDTIRYFQAHRKLDLPVDYETQVNRSLHCFKSQIVIDPLTLNQVLLHGNIDPKTGKFTPHWTFLNLLLTVAVFFILSTRTWLEQLCHLMTKMITVRLMMIHMLKMTWLMSRHTFVLMQYLSRF